MKKLILIFIFVFATLLGASAQKKITRSYGRVVSFTGGSQTYGSTAIWIDFYDGYIEVLSCMRYDYSGRNSNGEAVYVSTKRSDDKYIISKGYNEIRNMYDIPWINQTITQTTYYRFIGNGREPAVNYGK